MNEKTSICRECENKGNSVKEITLKSLVKEPKLKNIRNFTGFHFCETLDCRVVYFNNEQNLYLHKEDVALMKQIKQLKELKIY